MIISEFPDKIARQAQRNFENNILIISQSEQRLGSSVAVLLKEAADQIKSPSESLRSSISEVKSLLQDFPFSKVMKENNFNPDAMVIESERIKGILPGYEIAVSNEITAAQNSIEHIKKQSIRLKNAQNGFNATRSKSEECEVRLSSLNEALKSAQLEERLADIQKFELQYNSQLTVAGRASRQLGASQRVLNQETDILSDIINEVDRSLIASISKLKIIFAAYVTDSTPREISRDEKLTFMTQLETSLIYDEVDELRNEARSIERRSEKLEKEHEFTLKATSIIRGEISFGAALTEKNAGFLENLNDKHKRGKLSKPKMELLDNECKEFLDKQAGSSSQLRNHYARELMDFSNFTESTARTMNRTSKAYKDLLIAAIVFRHMSRALKDRQS